MKVNNYLFLFFILLFCWYFYNFLVIFDLINFVQLVNQENIDFFSLTDSTQELDDLVYYVMWEDWSIVDEKSAHAVDYNYSKLFDMDLEYGEWLNAVAEIKTANYLNAYLPYLKSPEVRHYFLLDKFMFLNARPEKQLPLYFIGEALTEDFMDIYELGEFIPSNEWGLSQLFEYLQVREGDKIADYFCNPVFTSFNTERVDYKPVTNFKSEELAAVELAYLDMYDYLPPAYCYDELVMNRLQGQLASFRFFEERHNLLPITFWLYNSPFQSYEIREAMGDYVIFEKAFAEGNILDAILPTRHYEFEITDEEYVYVDDMGETHVGASYDVYCINGPYITDIEYYNTRLHIGLSGDNTPAAGYLNHSVDDYFLNRVAIYDNIGLNNKIVRMYSYFFNSNIEINHEIKYNEEDYTEDLSNTTFFGKFLYYMSKLKYFGFGLFLVLMMFAGVAE